MEENNKNILVGNAVVDNILKRNKEFSFCVSGVTYKYTTVDYDGVKCVYGSSFKKEEQNEKKSLFPRSLLVLYAVYIDPSRILLLSSLRTTRKQGLSFEESIDMVRGRVLSRIKRITDSIKADDIVVDNSFSGMVKKLSWIIALDDLKWSDIHLDFETSDQELIYTLMTGDYDGVAEQWVQTHMEVLKNEEAVRSAAEKKSIEFAGNPFVALFKQLKNDEESEVFKIKIENGGKITEHYIFKEGLMRSLRNIFEQIPALGVSADSIVSICADNNLVWEKA